MMGKPIPINDFHVAFGQAIADPEKSVANLLQLQRDLKPGALVHDFGWIASDGRPKPYLVLEYERALPTDGDA